MVEGNCSTQEAIGLSAWLCAMDSACGWLLLRARRMSDSDCSMGCVYRILSLQKGTALANEFGRRAAGLPQSWQVVTLNEISLRPGEYGSISAAIPWTSELPRYVRITDIDGNGSLSPDNIAGIDWDKARPYLLSEGDLCFARSGATVGKTYLYDRRDGFCAFAGYVIRFSIDSMRALPEYVSAWTRSGWYSQWVSSVVRQGAQPNINAKEYGAHRLPLPPLREQRKIVDVLSSVDNSIRSLKCLVAKLEVTKQGVLDDLLGPERCADWRVVTVGEILAEKPRNGYSPLPGAMFSGVYMLGLGCLTQTGFMPSQLKFAPADDPIIERALLVDGDLLMSRANTRDLVGMVGRYRDIGQRCIYPDLMMRLRVGPLVLPDFLELLLRQPDCRRQIESLSSGTSESMVKISSKSVANLVVRIPVLSEQRQVIDVYNSFTDQLNELYAELAKLQDIERGLMNDLFAGRLRNEDDLVGCELSSL
jgi:type I restriction enzyme S subunit